MPQRLSSGQVMTVVGLLSVAAPAPAQRVHVGRNVNMVSGTELPGGDPYLQRQNEPSIAASTRNPLHLLAGANDYRTVDLPGVNGAVETGDAWQGVFFSDDGGESWTSTLLPGFPQDQSREGLDSPLKGFDAASDPVVRAGPHGLFFYSGIGFDRGEEGASALFLARYLDLNDTENANPVVYIDTISVDRRPRGYERGRRRAANEFIDKPWLAVDLPRHGARWCSIEVPEGEALGRSKARQRFRGGNVYLAYSVISREDDGELRSKIQFTVSRDCGASWSDPVRLSPSSHRVNQGATVAIDPAKGTVYVAWRQFSLGNDGQDDAIHVARSEDGGRSFELPEAVCKLRGHRALHSLWKGLFDQKADKRLGKRPRLQAGELDLPFDQPTLPSANVSLPGLELVRAFRVNSYPTMTVDAESRVYVAWSEMGHGPEANPETGDPGDARIVVTTGKKGKNWLEPPLVVDAPRDPEGEPRSGHQIMPSLTFGGGKLFLAYYDFRDDAVEIEGPTPYILDPIPDNGLRHSVDLRVAVAEPGREPQFTPEGAPSARASRYLFTTDSEDPLAVRQAQNNFVNFPLFDQGRVPFLGDYLDASPSRVMVQDDRGRWEYDVGGEQSGVFHIAWADNRDVVPPLNGDWTTYEPPTSLQPAPFSSPVFGGPLETCSERTGMRNQNIYSARVTEGLVVGSPSNTKPLGETTLPGGGTVLIQRAFVAFLRNTTEEERSYRLTVLDQPPDFNPGAPASAGQASFLQFEHRTTLDASIPAHSSIARPVFVKSSDETASIRILVQQIDAPAGSVIAGGLSGLIRLNPDFLNPEILNPEILNPDQSPIAIESEEVHNPEILNPEILNPEILNAEIPQPEILNPDIVNPEILNADLFNPEILNPEILNPEILNAARTGALKDFTWTLRNDGNTTTSYAARPFIRSAPPEGFRFQLLVYRIHSTPAVNLLDCRLETEPLSQRQHHELLVDIRNPEILNSEIFNPEILNPEILNASANIATFFIAPGESLKVTLRVLDPDRNDDIVLAEEAVSLATVAHSVNTVEAALGVTDPPVSHQASAAPVLGSGSLLSPLLGVFYDQLIPVSGGVAPLTWTVVTGSLPSGIALDSATGRLSGLPSQPGDFVFEIAVTDSAIPPRTNVRSFTLTVAASVFAYVANDPSNNVTVFDTATNTVAATIELGFGRSPHSLAVSPDGRILYTANTEVGVPSGGTVSVIDTATNTVSATIPTGGANVGIAITPDGSTLYVASYGAPWAVWVVDTATRTVTQSIALGADVGPFHLAITPNGDAVYVPRIFTDDVAVIDTATNTVTATIPVGGNPHRVAISPDGSLAYVSNSDEGTVSVISTATNAVTATIPVATGIPANLAEDIVFSNDGSRAYVSNTSLNFVSIIDTSTNTVVDTITVGTRPLGLAISADGSRLYVGNQTSATVAVVDTQTNTVVATVPTAPGSGPADIALVSRGAAGPVLGSTLPDALVGAFYDQLIPVSGGVAPLTWSIVNGSLPPGLSLASATGRISGTPSLFGDFVFEVAVTDSAFPPRTSSRIFTLMVGAPITTLAGAPVPDGVPALSVGGGDAWRMAVDSTGTVFLSSTVLHVVRAVDTTTGIISIVAGNSTLGPPGDGGLARDASLFSPMALAFDTSGNLYIAEFGGSRIRRVDAATRIITSVAGTGFFGFSGDGGPATAAEMRGPSGLAIDSAGNLYIADGLDSRIRRVDAATGVITTVAGTGTAGFSGDGGPAVAAQLGGSPFFGGLPYLDVSVDAGGNLFICELGNHRVRRVDAVTGIITTVAGNGNEGFSGDGGPATAANLGHPLGVTVDASGDLWIAGTNHIRHVDMVTGTIRTVVGGGTGGDGGPALAAQLWWPSDVSLDTFGNVYIVDAGDQRVRRVDNAGIITTFVGNGSFNGGGDGGAATSATLGIPRGIALDAAGSLLIADSRNNQVRRVDGSSSVISTVAGVVTRGAFSGDGGPAVLAELSDPEDITIDASGNILIADTLNHRIRRVDALSNLITTVAGSGILGFAGDGGPALLAEFGYISGISVNEEGDLLIADASNHRVRHVDSVTGIITTIAGTGEFESSGDGGPAVLAGVSDPMDVAFDDEGNLFISELTGHRIRRVDASTGLITTIAGTGTRGFSGDGDLAIAARLNEPVGVAMDSFGDLFIADSGNGLIRRVDMQTGIISTVVGGGTSVTDGVANEVILWGPNYIAFDNAGRLVFSEAYANRIRVVLLRN